MAAPGNAVASLAVASIVDSYQLRDGLKVNAPSTVAGIAAGQFSIAYDWATKPPVTGDVTKIPGRRVRAPAAGTTLTAATALLAEREAPRSPARSPGCTGTTTDATRQCGSGARANNVAAAGAIGAIFTSSLDVFGAGITGATP